MPNRSSMAEHCNEIHDANMRELIALERRLENTVRLATREGIAFAEQRRATQLDGEAIAAAMAPHMLAARQRVAALAAEVDETIVRSVAARSEILEMEKVGGVFSRISAHARWIDKMRAAIDQITRLRHITDAHFELYCSDLA